MAILDELRARIAVLEAENERIFREAQLATDTIFAEYQLSQILATHEAPTTLAAAVLDELLHVCGGEAGVIWTLDPRSGHLETAARSGGDTLTPEADELVGVDAIVAGARAWSVVRLDDGGRLLGLLAIATPVARPMPDEQRRLLELVRHELAVAIRGAQLRAELERERAELSAVIEGASDAIVVVDERRRITRVNAAAARMLGAAPATLRDVVCSEALACEKAGFPPRPCGGQCPFERTLRSGKALHGDERLVGRGAGAVRVLGSYTLASRSPAGTAAVAIYRDTSELARLAELRRGFLATVSHELRTPLALVKGYVETLLHLDPDTTMARSYLERIDRTTDRLTHLVSQIVDVTQLAAGQLTLERQAVDLAGLLSAARDDLLVREPSLTIELRADPDLPSLTADAGRLRQVIDNLLANAAKYSAPAGRVGISAIVEAADVVLRIEDDGIGIPADERELVFEQFHRGRNVRESRLPGSGLGLTISRSLVEAHGGTLTIDGHHEPGTAFVVRLPLEAATYRQPRAGDLPLAATEARG